MGLGIAPTNALKEHETTMIEGLAREPPQSPKVTDYDRAHLTLYLRLLDADGEGADWREVARILFGVDAVPDEVLARRIYDSHLDRARWMTKHGYLDLLNSKRKED